MREEMSRVKITSYSSPKLRRWRVLFSVPTQLFVRSLVLLEFSHRFLAEWQHRCQSARDNMHMDPGLNCRCIDLSPLPESI